MGLSVGGIGNMYGMSFVQPLNYKLKNEADISDAFTETGMQGAVMNVPPVIYPNAQIASTQEDSDSLSMSMDYVKKSQEANRAYNEVAQKFQGMTVGYGQNMSGQTYGVQGASLDLFA